MSKKIIDYAPLQRGDNGRGVKMVQLALAASGYALNPDGNFGSITKDAVIAFAKNAGVEVPTGVVTEWLAKKLDLIPIPIPPEDDELDYWFLMYGLGDASTSAGMDVLNARLRAMSNKRVVAPTVSWSDRQSIIDRIKKLPLGVSISLAGNSMGANAIPMITNACPERKFKFVAGYDPTIWWSCPAFGTNVEHALLFHGMNWLNPIGHARYTPAFASQIETVNTMTTHVAIDDDTSLHAITLNRAQKYGV